MQPIQKPKCIFLIPPLPHFNVDSVPGHLGEPKEKPLACANIEMGEGGAGGKPNVSKMCCNNSSAYGSPGHVSIAELAALLEVKPATFLKWWETAKFVFPLFPPRDGLPKSVEL